MARYKPEGWPKQGRNVIFYPRQYALNPEKERESYVVGVSTKGKPFKMYLKLNPLYLKNYYESGSHREKVLPKLEDFARTARSAKRACIASPTNGPDNHEGVLLFSKVFPLKDRPDEYAAEWAVVLAQDHSCPSPLTGFGRMEIDFAPMRFESDEVKALAAELKSLKARMLSSAGSGNGKPQPESERIMQISREIQDKRKVKFRGLLERIESIQQISPNGKPLDENRFRDACARIIQEQTTEDGCYGGVLARTRIGNQVILSSCAKAQMVYREEKERMTPHAAVNDMMNYGRGKAVLMAARMYPDAVIELIPFRQINCGPQGNLMYRKSPYYDTIKKTFIAPEGKMSRSAPVVIRPVTAHTNGNILLGSIFAVGAPVGNILTLDQTGKPAYQLAADYRA